MRFTPCKFQYGFTDLSEEIGIGVNFNMAEIERQNKLLKSI
jgi:hypothetical protein